MNIGPAARADAPLLAKLHAKCFRDAWTADAFANLQSHGHAFALIAKIDSGESLAGFILIQVAAPDAEVLSVGVAPEFRRLGLGRALVRAGGDRAHANGAAALFLEVNVSNAPALAMYRALGFSQAGLRRGYYQNCDSVADALILRCGLPIPAWESHGDSIILPAHNSGGQMTRIEKLCADKGLRMTDQRRVIARVLSEASDHPDAEELYRRAAVVDPHISIATVYRTVRLFEDAGILERHDFRDGRSRYEEAPDAHHDHLIDVQSGKVIEFRNEEIEHLQRRVAEELGFELVDHRLELYAVPRKKAGER